MFIEERTVDVHVLRLRKALAPTGARQLVQTVRGVGYRISTQAGTVIQRIALRAQCEASRRTSLVAVQTRLVECLNA